MSNSKIHLKEYDMVVAVTQQAINETMAGYLYQLKKDVVLYYTADDKGNLMPAKEEADAAYIFKGRLDYTRDAEGNPVDMVKLHVPGECQKVNYNVTFKDAEFSSKYPPKFKIEQRECPDPWIISFQVSLTLQDTELAKLPEGIRKKVEEYVKNLGPDMFSIQQLCVDLNTAVFDKFQNVTGMTQVSEALFIAIMKDYVTRQQEQGSILFGYGIKHSGKNNALPPTFMPTALNFCVTPYQDSKGGTNPNLDTLNYLVMTNNHAPPRDIPKTFDFNWVEDSSEHGAIGIKRELLIPFIIKELNLILNFMSPIIKVNAKNKSIDMSQKTTGQTFNVLDFAKGASLPIKLASFDYSASGSDRDPHDDLAAFFTGKIQVDATYHSNCNVVMGSSTKLCISGSTVVSARIQDHSEYYLFKGRGPAAGGTDSKLPSTTYEWSVNMELAINNNTGQLHFKTTEPSFDKKPTVEGWNDNIIEQLWNALHRTCCTYRDDISGLRSNVKNCIVNNILDSLTKALSPSNDFVFPGGKTFIFKQPMFSESMDLTSTITYRSPADKGELK
jgi:hypothetical protein